jgi:hypothetical protein
MKCITYRAEANTTVTKQLHINWIRTLIFGKHPYGETYLPLHTELSLQEQAAVSLFSHPALAFSVT